MDKRAYLTYTAAVFIPLLQACIIGMLSMLITAAVCKLFENASTSMWMLLAASITASLSWLSSVRWWRERLIDAPAPALHQAPPLYKEPEPQSVKITLVESDGRAGSYLELPAPPSKLQALASGLMSGKSFTEAAWTGSGGIFTRAEFVKLRDEMLRRGLLELNSPSTAARGYSLTRGGRACIRYLATTTTPLLEADTREPLYSGGACIA